MREYDDPNSLNSLGRKDRDQEKALNLLVIVLFCCNIEQVTVYIYFTILFISIVTNIKENKCQIKIIIFFHQLKIL